METTRRDEALQYLHIREREQLTGRELSELSDIPIATLQWWRRKLRDEVADAFVEIPVRVAESDAFFRDCPGNGVSAETEMGSSDPVGRPIDDPQEERIPTPDPR